VAEEAVVRGLNPVTPQVERELVAAIGAEKVSSRVSDRVGYAFTGTGEPPLGKPDVGVLPGLVVQPRTAADVQAVVRLANRYLVPIATVTSNFQSSHPVEGCILLDCYRMNRVHEVNPLDGYAVIEPGVTFGQLQSALRPHGYRFPFGSFPETTSVVGHLMRASGAWNTWAQTGGRELANLELVLGNGELLRTGAAALPHDDWSVLSPHAICPDLTRLFIGTNATLGVVTRATVRIWPLNEAQDFIIAGFDTLRDGVEASVALSRAWMVEGAALYPWSSAHEENFFGSCFSSKEDYPPRFKKAVQRLARGKPEKPEGWPNYWGFFPLTGFKDVLNTNLKFIRKYLAEHGAASYTEPQLRKMVGPVYERWWARVFREHLSPNDISRLKYGGHHIEGEAAWVLVGPSSAAIKLEADFKRLFAEEGMEGRGFAYKIVDQGRTGYLRFSVHLPEGQKTPEKLAHVRMRILELAGRYGVHSVTPWTDGGEEQALLAHQELLRRIREYCDPNGILNPRARAYGMFKS